MNREQIIARHLECMNYFLGIDYSRTYRYRYYNKANGGSGDCSSLQAGAASYSGHPLLDSKGKQLLTSCYEVYAEDYDLVYPARKDLIGKSLPSASNLITTIGVQPGDLVFFNFSSTTNRANKITHIACVLDSEHYIHTANNREKCCIVPITWGRSHICAITRLKADLNVSIPTEVLKKDNADYLLTKTLQVNLNVLLDEKLVWDGKFGTKTEAALVKYQKKVGLSATGICDKETWSAIFEGAEKVPVTPEPEPEVPVTPVPETEEWTLNRLLKLKDERMTGDDVKALQRALIKEGISVGSAKDDGIFGPRTEAGVIEFQKKKKLKVDGIVGKQTCTALGGTWKSTSATPASNGSWL